MRIIQIIDSLHVGGAERMAVNYANALACDADFSALVTTRKEGELKSAIDSGVDYLFLNKKSALDWQAIFRLRSYCVQNKIDVIHAHGTSFFTAVLLKLTLCKIRIVWHEHKGARSGEGLAKNMILWMSSKFFSGIIVVDRTLDVWCHKVLGFKNVIYLPNFTLFSNSKEVRTVLKGEAGKRILCIANLRHPKNHMLLVAVARGLAQKYPDWTFHFVGNDFDDAYAKALKRAISEHSLTETVYIYGLREDTGAIIAQAEICVLGSISEGLPVALLEYGMHQKAVVATHVGEIPRIISSGVNGFTVASGDVDGFTKALIELIENQQLRHDFGAQLHNTIKQNHSKQAVIATYLNWLNQK